MSVKLIFVDVDDTLYSKRTRKVPDSARTALKKAQQNGHKVLINTGRPMAYFEKEILDLDFDGYLCSNGQYIMIDNQLVYHRTFPKDTLEAVMNACEKYHIFGTLEGDQCSYFRNHDIDFHPHYGFMIQAFDLEPEMPHEFSWDNAGSCEKIIVFGGEGSDVPGFLKELDRFRDVLDYITIDDTQFEILVKGHNKATGLEEAVKYYQTSLENCYAFGDSNNDTEMIQTAGHGIAMGNACEELKEIADYITTDIDEGGISHGLNHFHLI